MCLFISGRGATEFGSRPHCPLHILCTYFAEDETLQTIIFVGDYAAGKEIRRRIVADATIGNLQKLCDHIVWSVGFCPRLELHRYVGQFSLRYILLRIPRDLFAASCRDKLENIAGERPLPFTTKRNTFRFQICRDDCIRVKRIRYNDKTIGIRGNVLIVKI